MYGGGGDSNERPLYSDAYKLRVTILKKCISKVLINSEYGLLSWKSVQGSFKLVLVQYAICPVKNKGIISHCLHYTSVGEGEAWT